MGFRAENYLNFLARSVALARELEEILMGAKIYHQHFLEVIGYRTRILFDRVPFSDQLRVEFSFY